MARDTNRLVGRSLDSGFGFGAACRYVVHRTMRLVLGISDLKILLVSLISIVGSLLCVNPSIKLQYHPVLGAFCFNRYVDKSLTDTH